MSWLVLLRIAMGLWLLYTALDVGGRHPQPAVIQVALWSGSLTLIFGALTRLAAAILFGLAIYFIHSLDYHYFGMHRFAIMQLSALSLFVGAAGRWGGLDKILRNLTFLPASLKWLT
jgi:hypothetical protein